MSINLPIEQDMKESSGRTCAGPEHCAELIAVGGEVHALREKVFGNGTPGILSDMRSISDQQRMMQVDMRQMKLQVEYLQRILWLTAGALGGLQIVIKML